MPTTTIEWMFPDGAGGARTATGVVRIEGALPGDVVRWKPGKGTSGELEAITSSSPDRVPPPCAWDSTCGGCDLAALNAAGRHRALARVAARAFGLTVDPMMVPSPRPVGHRARIKLAIREGVIGYRPERSHGVVPIETCRIARPEVDAALSRLRAWSTPERARGLASVELRSDGTRAIYAFESDGRFDRDALSELGDVAVDGSTLSGDPVLRLRVGGVELRASPRSFYQVNLEIDELLVATVRERVRSFQPERVLDLYAGIGNLTLPIAADRVPVVAVEREGQATGDLRAARGTLPVEVIEADVDRFDASRCAFDVVVLDPPRAGAPGVIERLLRQRPKGLVYVACDAVNAARDIRSAIKAGYRLGDVTCFDMFPETRHFETVISLHRK